ncbi:SAM-dependent methyltransferase [Aquimarina brevivitae]|uniref:Tellurite resistance protein TehB n=1 Tax=Aquimarina brevivitae TaxID=323412 RepID=A0A4Q7NTI7_9FLAO|nr:class I SAM-dependent methyltransferase [Aquimarina brevivitae]RZS90427.1 tellurite resistance protein TehB [Aquimarina brevivitae]
MLKDLSMWYTSWFDTPYYHTLYKDRNHVEAKLFMDNLTQYLNLSPGEKILDLACGKGRHSIYLNSLGFNVTGVDLSENSIAYASQFENDSLQFKVHDMCKPFNDSFTAVFNLFTSFGYFDKDDDNLKTIKAIKTDLSEYGVGVIDFMNVNYVIDNLVAEETKTVDGITFDIKRYTKDNYIYKNISFEADGEQFNFTERVRAFSLADFMDLFEKAGVYLFDTFGNYSLGKFDITTSPRLILLFK